MITVIFALIAAYNYKYFVANYVLIAFCMLAKLAVILTLILIIWPGFSSCHMTSSLKATILSLNILEILVMVFQVVLLKRVKKAHREISIQKLVQSKTFAETDRI